MSRGVNPLFIGLFSRPGPAGRPKATPFGHDSWEKEAFDLTPAQLRVVVALLAAEFTGVGPVTIAQCEEVTGGCCHSVMPYLVRGRWAEQAGRVDRSREKLWRATRTALRRLFPNGWQVAA